jgi:hypothetical protein
MTQKKLTKDCPSCHLCSADNSTYNFLCSWGNSKKRKVLYETKTLKKCNLKR